MHRLPGRAWGWTAALDQDVSINDVFLDQDVSMGAAFYGHEKAPAIWRELVQAGLVIAPPKLDYVDLP